MTAGTDGRMGGDHFARDWTFDLPDFSTRDCHRNVRELSDTCLVSQPMMESAPCWLPPPDWTLARVQDCDAFEC